MSPLDAASASSPATSPARDPSSSPANDPAQVLGGSQASAPGGPQAGRATCAPDRAFPAADVAAAEAPLTAGTDRYMRAAARAVTLACLRELGLVRSATPGGRVLALVGGGSNGADALLACAMLARQGSTVTALLGGRSPASPVGAAADIVEEARAAGVEVVEAASSPASSPPAGLTERTRAAVAALGREGGVVIDGLTGIGGSGPLRPAAAALVRAVLAAPSPPGDQRQHARTRSWRVVAVDVPSGTGVDDGTLPGPVLPADRTVTFTCLKGALCLPPACHLAGRLDVVDLGLPVPGGPGLAHRPAQTALARALRTPGTHDHKYTRGVVGLWAGSTTYPGAAVLAASAAVRSGAGMVRLRAPRRVEDLVLAARPEVVPAAGRCQAVVIGPGTDPDDQPRAEQLRGALLGALADPAGGAAGEAAGDAPDGAVTPAVVDAGALALLPALLEQGASCTPWHVLTPHAGEAATLLTALGRRWTRPQVEEQPLAAARALSSATGATVVLKGAVTLVVPPDGTPLCVDGGPGWLATAGSGDVLAGVLGALLASAAAPGVSGAPGPLGSPRSQRRLRGGEDLPAPGEAAAGAAVVATVVAAGVRLHALAGACAAWRHAWGPGDAGSQGPAAARTWEPSGPCEPPAGGAAGGAGSGTVRGRGHPVAAADVVEALPVAWLRMTGGSASGALTGRADPDGPRRTRLTTAGPDGPGC